MKLVVKTWTCVNTFAWTYTHMCRTLDCYLYFQGFVWKHLHLLVCLECMMHVAHVDEDILYIYTHMFFEFLQSHPLQSEFVVCGLNAKP